MFPPDLRCPRCQSFLFAPKFAAEEVRDTADYVCLSCGTSYSFQGCPPALGVMNPRMFLPEHADAFIEEFGHLADERGLMPMAITCYLVRSAGKNILIDTGLGNRRRPNFPVGHLDESLANAGLALGMHVIGFDPGLTVEGAAQLSPAGLQTNAMCSPGGAL